MVCLDSFKLQTMTAFNKKLFRGCPEASRGGFLEKSPPMLHGAEGIKIFKIHNKVNGLV
jgi:hypothetical protein